MKVKCYYDNFMKMSPTLSWWTPFSVYKYLSWDIAKKRCNKRCTVQTGTYSCQTCCSALVQFSSYVPKHTANYIVWKEDQEMIAAVCAMSRIEKTACLSIVRYGNKHYFWISKILFCYLDPFLKENLVIAIVSLASRCRCRYKN